MRTPKLVLLVALLLILVIIGVATLSINNISTSLKLGTSEVNSTYDNKVLAVDGWIINLPFNKTYIHGNATVANQVWTFSRYSNESSVELLEFKSLPNNLLTIMIHRLNENEMYNVVFNIADDTILYEATPLD